LLRFAVQGDGTLVADADPTAQPDLFTEDTGYSYALGNTGSSDSLVQYLRACACVFWSPEGRAKSSADCVWFIAVSL